MSKEKKTLEESLAIRYMDLAGINSINEEVEIDELSEPVEGVAAGGENLVHPIDHAKVVSDESNVAAPEVLNPVSGEVDTSSISLEKIEEAVRNHFSKLLSS